MTVESIARRYGVGRGLVRQRVESYRRVLREVGTQGSPLTVDDLSNAEREERITDRIREACRQLDENCGGAAAVRRALAVVLYEYGRPSGGDRPVRPSDGTPRTPPGT